MQIIQTNKHFNQTGRINPFFKRLQRFASFQKRYDRSTPSHHGYKALQLSRTAEHRQHQPIGAHGQHIVYLCL